MNNDRLNSIIRDLETIYRELKEIEKVINKDKNHIEITINYLKKEGDINKIQLW